jgi:hypothetical protein
MTDESDVASATDSHRSGRLRRVLLLTGGALGLTLLAGLFILSRFLEPDRLASWLEPRVEAAVNRDVSVGSAEVGILPLGIRLREVSISDPTGLAPRLAYLETLELRVRVLPLLRREVQVRQIRLDGLEGNLAVGPDSTTNFGDFSAAEDPAEEQDADGEAPPFGLRLDEIRIAGGSVSYRNLQDSLLVRVSGLEGRASVRREAQGPWEFDGGLEGSLAFSGTLPSQAGPRALEAVPLSLSLDMETDPDFGAVRIREGTLALDRVRLGVRGEAEQLKDPVRQISLAIEADGIRLEDVVALLPDSLTEGRGLESEGILSTELAVQGSLGPESSPDILGSLSVRDGTLRMSGTSLFEAMQITVELAEDGVVRPRADGRLLGGPLALSGVLRLEGGAVPVDLQVRMDPDLSLLGQGLAPEGMTLGGRLPSDIRVTGDASDPAQLALWGELGLRDLAVTHPTLGVPVSAAQADLALEGDRATLAPASVGLGDDVVEVRGSLVGLAGLLDGGTPEFRGAARGSRISLVELVAEPPPDTALTYGRVAFARVGGRRVRGLDADAAAREMGLERPARIPLAGEVQVSLDTLVDRRGRMEAVEATLVFGPDFLEVTESSFRRYGGRIQTSGGLRLGSEPEEPFSLKVMAQGVDAGAFLGETTPLGQAVTGRLDLDLDLVGALDGLLLPSRSTLQGSGAFSLTGGGIDLGSLGDRLATFLGVSGLASPRIQDWSTGFVLRDGRILLDEAALEGAPGAPRVGGGVGLDGALDLVTAFDLPREEMESEALQRLGIPQSAGATDMVAAVLRVGGSLTDPAVRADAGATARTVAGAVEEQAREELDRQIEETRTELRDRASGFLRGLLGGRDTARTPPPDTLRLDTLPPDTLVPDTLPPDTLPPDTLVADTLPTDTVPPDTLRLDTVPPAAGAAGGL